MICPCCRKTSRSSTCSWFNAQAKARKQGVLQGRVAFRDSKWHLVEAA